MDSWEHLEHLRAHTSRDLSTAKENQIFHLEVEYLHKVSQEGVQMLDK